MSPSNRSHFLRRFFHYQGSISGIRVDARVAILDLTSLDTPSAGREIGVIADAKRIGSASIPGSDDAMCDVWESEGGALGRTGPEARLV